MKRSLPKGERRQPGEGGGMAAAVQGISVTAGPRGTPPPCPPFSLALIGVVEKPSPLEMAAKGETIS
jgi:hypothetical protein